VALVAVWAPTAALAGDRFDDIPHIAAKIDELLAKHWSAQNIQPAQLTTDAEFFRRLSLDLAGRVPTEKEARAFVADGTSEKRNQSIRRLIESPEFALHFGRVLDGVIQQDRGGNREFVEYLRTAVRDDRRWDDIYRAVMLGPWDDPKQQAAAKFLTDRVRSADEMTADSGRAFFGVDISCARCHDHPHVDDWKQRNYYGMVSFFKPTQTTKGKGKLLETDDREVKFRDTLGKEHVAKPTFLSGKELDSEAKGGMRESLVRESLADPVFFRRAIVNQTWAYLFGRGLVDPVDQMHSSNPPSVPDLLEWLADDFAQHGYDLKRLVAGIAASRAYQLTSAWPADPGAPGRPDESAFAVANVRPVSPEQLALSLIVITGGELDSDPGAPGQKREKQYRELEQRASGLVDKKFLDRRENGYQASVSEAMFMSNHPDVQKLFEPSASSLTRRLIDEKGSLDNGAIIEAAVWGVLGRPPEADERQSLTNWLTERAAQRSEAIQRLLWSLATSSEFRFNH
jgi:hypothetical protein